MTYTPLDTDFHSVCLAVSSNDPARPVANLGLTAQGAAAPTPAVALVPDALDFMTVEVGASSSLTAQVENLGGAPLAISSIAACTGTSAEFTWSPAAPFSVAPGEAQALTVSYAPLDQGPDNGCLALATDDPLRPTVNLGLTGAGTVTPAFPAIALVPGSLDFGSVTEGGSATRTTQVQNAGTAPLEVMAIAACAGTTAEFTWTPAGPFTVAPGQSAPLAVAYAPTDVGADEGCLTVASNDPANPTVQLQLAGTGSTPPVSGVDIDIRRLRVPEELEREDGTTIVPSLDVANRDAVSGSASARLIAVFADEQVYDQTITITLARGARGRFPFPPHTVAGDARGTLRWTATVADDDADTDQATARTKVKLGREHDDDDDEGDDETPSKAGDPLVATSSGVGYAGEVAPNGGGCSVAGPVVPLTLLLAAAALLARRRARAKG